MAPHCRADQGEAPGDAGAGAVPCSAGESLAQAGCPGSLLQVHGPAGREAGKGDAWCALWEKTQPAIVTDSKSLNANSLKDVQINCHN